ncbi:MAG: VPLPA-CTERM sorting domain-containing protein [Syntrophorhabdales bacterium]|jgi:hypothetical protein
MMKRFVFIAAIVSSLFAASIASADIQLAFYDVQNATTVNITYTFDSTNGGPATPISSSQSPYTGQYQLQLYNSSGPIINAVCVSPLLADYSFQTYSQDPITSSAYAYLLPAAWVLSQGYTTATDRQAAQLAVWELVWDNGESTYNFSSGKFTVSGESSAVLSDAESIYTAALAGASSIPNGAYVLADSTTHQEYVMRNPVPIPAAVWLLGSGLIGLAGIRRRFRK